MNDTKFQIDQKIVYPSQGVGKITEIFEKDFRGNLLTYYKIYIEASDMVVMVPVDKAEELGIRAIVSAEEAQKALDLLSADFEPITSDWKLRYQMNLDLLKKGTSRVFQLLFVFWTTEAKEKDCLFFTILQKNYLKMKFLLQWVCLQKKLKLLFTQN